MLGADINSARGHTTSFPVHTQKGQVTKSCIVYIYALFSSAAKAVVVVVSGGGGGGVGGGVGVGGVGVGGGGGGGLLFNFRNYAFYSKMVNTKVVNLVKINNFPYYETFV